MNSSKKLLPVALAVAGALLIGGLYGWLVYNEHSSGGNAIKRPAEAPIEPSPLGDKPDSHALQADEVTVVGKMIKYKKKKRFIYAVRDLDNRNTRLPLGVRKDAKKEGDNADEFIDCFVRLTGKGEWIEEEGESVLDLHEISSLEKLDDAELEALTKRPHDPSPKALPYAGTWGVRMSLPTKLWADELKAFDAEEFAAQVGQLSSASHIMLNVTHPANSCYYTGPHPGLAEVMGRNSFAERDLLGEVLDALAPTGKKVLVYFAAEGFYHDSAKKPMKAKWTKHIESLGLSPQEATRELILKHYATRYGTKISGWWFDGAKDLDEADRIRWKETIREANPEAIVAFNRMAGPPFRSTRQCDYFGGHPTPRSKKMPWDMVNAPMIESVEKGAWMDIFGEPVGDPGDGALGHVFMPMQARWNFGACEFPPEQAIDWTKRTLRAGGMYTWVVPRNGSEMQADQFALLLQINKAVEEARGSLQ